MPASKKKKLVTEDAATAERVVEVSRNPIFKQPTILSKTEQKNILQDGRFSSMFTDPKFEVTSKDKRGRPVLRANRQLTPQAFYGLKQNETKAVSSSSESNEESDYDGSDEDLGRTDKVRGIGLHVAGEEAQDTSDSEGEESGFVANDDARIEESEEEEDELEDKPAPILVDNATRRIAVQHLDWGIIRARDLLVLFRSFCPEDGEVRRVTIYPSKFGMERLRVERVSGPPELTALREQEALGVQLGSEDNHRRAVQRAIRRYQHLLHKYYFAVVECDSVHTADNIYESLEGYEFEKSGCILDLSFIPDDMSFDIPEDFQNCISRCERAPRNYKLNPFFSKSKMHSDVSMENLSWDTTPRDRSRFVASFFRTDADLQQLEQEDMLGQVLKLSSSESDDDSDDGGNGIAQLRRGLKPRLGAAEMRALLLGDEAGEKNEEDEVSTDEENELMQYVDEVVGSECEDKEMVLPCKTKSKLKKRDATVSDEDNSIRRNAMSSTSGSRSKKDVVKKRKKEEKVVPEMEVCNNNAVQAQDSIKGDERRSKLKHSQLSSEHKKAHRRKKRRRLEEQLTAADEDGELALLLHKGSDTHRKCSQAPLAKRAAQDPRFAALRTDPRFQLDPNAPDFRLEATSAAELLTLQQQQQQQQQQQHKITDDQCESAADLQLLSRRVLADMGTTPARQSRGKKREARHKTAHRDNAAVMNFVEMAAEALNNT